MISSNKLYNLLDNGLKKRIRFLVRANVEDDSASRIVLNDLLKSHYGILTKKEIKICQTILESVGSGYGHDIDPLEIETRILGERTNLFADRAEIKATMIDLSCREVLNWKTLLNRHFSDDGSILRIIRCESISLHSVEVSKLIIQALYYASTMNYEMHNMRTLGYNYYADPEWMDILLSGGQNKSGESKDEI